MAAAVRSRLHVSVLTTALLLLALGWLAAPSSAAAETRCSATKCFAPSTAYPKQTGWYAWVGRPGNCNNGPFPGYFGPSESVMVCVMAPRYEAYELQRGAWVKRELTAGVAGYIHPFDATWRWVYVDGRGWLAVRAADVGILWSR